MFELGNLLFTEFDNPDSAFLYYEKSLEEKEDNPNAAQTYYAMGNYYLLKGDSLKAKEMFEIVYDNYKDDPIMNEAARQLGKPIFDFEKDEVAEEYLKAEAKYDSSDYQGAIKSFFKIYHENPKSKYAAKSLYTIGWILENELNNLDSAASIYDTLNTKYRSSEFARATVVKLTGYKQEQRRLQAIQDSIKKANEIKIAPAKTDTTKVQKEISVQDSSKVKNTLPDSVKTHKIKSIDDLKNIKGINSSILSNIKNNVKNKKASKVKSKLKNKKIKITKKSNNKKEIIKNKKMKFKNKIKNSKNKLKTSKKSFKKKK